MTRGRVVVVGLGPGGPDLLNQATRDAIDRIPVRFLRTTRHPSAAAVGEAVSFDDVYQSSSRIDDVYAEIVETVVAAAALHEVVLYAVPGSPVVAERTVAALRADGRVELDVVPAMSFLDLVWVRLGVDPIEVAPRVVDARRFAVDAAGERGPLLLAQCDSRQVLSEVKLAFEDEPPAEVVVLQRLGLPDERVFPVAWADLDRDVEPDHLTSLWVPEVSAPVARELAGFAEIVRELRERCPWDREQTHASLARYVVEEAYELVDAIAGGDTTHLEEELGDVLLQVFLHAAIAAQAGDFTVADVARGISEKMVRRHPHVFGEVSAANADEVRRNWDQIKREEKGDGGGGALAGVPASLPALLYAAKLGKRAAAVGFDWHEIAPVYEKVQEELRELRDDPTSADELGDVLFAVVNLARHLGHDPEVALRGAAARFRQRFEHVEQAAAARGLDLRTADASVVDDLWEAAKAALAAAGPA